MTGLTPEERALLDAVKSKLADRKAAKEAVKKKYKDKEKSKALTTAERLSRIEEILGL